MKPRVYIETTIASFYHETRSDAETVARRNWTREWWDRYSMSYECVTSEAVIGELSRGDYPHQHHALDFVRDLALLEINADVLQIVTTYVQHRVMPDDPEGDALHLALASFHRCDFLVTWNCRHLANANKFDHIRRINAQLGLHFPRLATPVELLKEGDPDDGNPIYS